MNTIFAKLLYEMEKKHDTVIATIISDQGSTPRGAGSQMLVGQSGRLVGTIGGILASAKMTNYRIEQLEKKVEKHNNVVERTYKLEGRVNEVEHEVKDLKEYHKP